MVSMRLLNRFVTRALVTISILLIAFNEYLIYFINQTSWNHMECSSKNCTRILFVADPQLLGKEYDKAIYSSLARWDSDRYLRKTFQRAVAFTKPEIICFLGDLLDEGNVASPHQFVSYVRRFQEIFQTKNKDRRVHLPGDNDIGGENGEYISNSNVRRFEIEFMHEDLFDYENRIRFFKINRMLLDFTNPDRENNAGKTRIGLSHMPILIAGGPLLRGVLADIDPHVVFSAHWHESRIFYYPSSKSMNFYESSVMTFDLAQLKNDHTYLEIMVPTCSYRMGTAQVGYGFATLDNNLLQYTVLWHSSRFIYLKLYLWWIGIALVILTIWKIITRCPIRLIMAKRQPNNRNPLPPIGQYIQIIDK